MLGYADESGEPGVKKNDNDFFVFCIVLINNRDQLQSCVQKINRFRASHHLPLDHEFHYATDSKRTRALFINFIHSLDIKFLSISIKKNTARNTASFAKMAKFTLELLEKKIIDATILMDINPSLYAELRRQKKNYETILHIAERKSQSNDLIQVADYVTALRTRFLKYPTKQGTVEAYSKIANRLIGSIEL